jgi:hypothetical protein
MTDAIIGRSECSLAWCSMSDPLQAISPGESPEIVELVLPELASLKQVPARRGMSVDCVCARNPAARFGSSHAAPELHASNIRKKTKRKIKDKIMTAETYCSHRVGDLLQRWCMNGLRPICSEYGTSRVDPS